MSQALEWLVRWVRPAVRILAWQVRVWRRSAVQSAVQELLTQLVASQVLEWPVRWVRPVV